MKTKQHSRYYSHHKENHQVVGMEKLVGWWLVNSLHFWKKSHLFGYP